MIIKANVFGRIEQSLILLKNNFLDFFVPFFIYNFISFLVFWVIFMSFWLSMIWNMDMNTDFFLFLNNPKIVIFIALWMILFITYLLLIIPVFLGLLKSIKQAINNEQITTKNNIFYWFSNLINSFKTYWYIFAYVALIPSIIFILWWILLIAWYFFNGLDFLKQIWLFLMIVWLVLFITFSIYRWYKTSFSIYSAVNNNSFTKIDFIKTISYTNNNWWRIFWNFLLVLLIILTVSSILSWIFSTVSFNNNIDIYSIESMENIKSLASNFSIVTESLYWFLNTTISTIWKIFWIIFTYLFYLRLKEEQELPIIIWTKESTIIENKVEL